jgi:hypothetical protein
METLEGIHYSLRIEGVAHCLEADRCADVLFPSNRHLSPFQGFKFGSAQSQSAHRNDEFGATHVTVVAQSSENARTN